MVSFGLRRAAPDIITLRGKRNLGTLEKEAKWVFIGWLGLILIAGLAALFLKWIIKLLRWMAW